MKLYRSFIFFILLLIASWSCNNDKVEKKGSADSIKVANPDSLEKASQQITNPYSPIDISPMDMSYYPPDYPKLKMTQPDMAPPVARVIYSRPHLQGRQLFHQLLKFGEPWRMGANESTELQLFRDVNIQSKKIKAGRYMLYCIPQSDSWTIVFNSNIDSWGLHPDSTKDIARFNIAAKQTDQSLEYFTILFEKMDSGAELIFAWDNFEARLPINF
ncbi:MAG: DUF2911 domain-containing protein [Bacteroidota bacterium]